MYVGVPRYLVMIVTETRGESRVVSGRVRSRANRGKSLNPGPTNCRFICRIGFAIICGYECFLHFRLTRDSELL